MKYEPTALGTFRKLAEKYKSREIIIELLPNDRLLPIYPKLEDFNGSVRTVASDSGRNSANSCASSATVQQVYIPGIPKEKTHQSIQSIPELIFLVEP
ncbi:hypothetical protein Trydic_g20832 [Trypoxylus dichotomus]